MNDSSLRDLAATVSSFGPADDLSRYLQDDSGLRASGAPCLVFRPRTTEEVAAVVRACRVAGKVLTIQGGRTGMAGGAVPDAGDVVMSLELMNQIDAFDETGGTITVQAGMVLETLCNKVEERGWYFPMDCGARASCQIGGNIATNMGGNRVLRYGTMRSCVLGLEAVLADGTVVSMLNHSLKDNTGLDLKHLFIGTEGTLGIITRAVLRLFPRPTRRDNALVAVPDLATLALLLKDARAQLNGLSSFEVMWRSYLEPAAKATGIADPFAGAYPLTVLLETETFTPGEDGREVLHAFLERQMENGQIVDAVLPQGGEQSARLWRLRGAIDDILQTMRPYVAFDVSVPLPLVEGFLERTTTRLDARWPEAQRLLFGHLGDGNLHLSTGPHAADQLAEVESIVYQEVQCCGGSISGEHGIGRIKKPFLHYSRSEPELALMRGICGLLDPANSLNPGRIIDAK